ncbi:MAG: TIM barrel protein, partial [Planctomycetota bacterium]
MLGALMKSHSKPDSHRQVLIQKSDVAVPGVGTPVAQRLDRRQVMAAVGACAGATLPSVGWPKMVTGDETSDRFALRFLVASCMYGYAGLREILPQMSRLKVDAIDLWPKVHGSQREEIASMGEEAFIDLLGQYGVHVGCLSQYKLGPFGLTDEIPLAARLQCPFIVTSAPGSKGLRGPALKEAVAAFTKRMQPHFAKAADAGVTILIENHGSSLLDHVDGIRWILDLADVPGFGFALAPAHLPQDPKLIAQLVSDSERRLNLFYAWQFGKGFRTKMSRSDEHLQLPG